MCDIIKEIFFIEAQKQGEKTVENIAKILC